MSEHDGEAPQYVVAHLRDRLAGEPSLAVLDVQVKVVSTKVFLHGEVSTPERRDRVGEVAREVCPEYDIHNELVVTRWAEDATPDSESLT